MDELLENTWVAPAIITILAILHPQHMTVKEDRESSNYTLYKFLAYVRRDFRAAIISQNLY